MRLAGMASATLSKLATAVPPRFLISSTTSSAGAALEPEPSEAPPGSLTTTLAPSAAQRKMREGVVDHEVIDIAMTDAGLPEGEGTCDLERARGVERLHLAHHRRLHTLAGALDVDRPAGEVACPIGGCQDQRTAAIC